MSADIPNTPIDHLEFYLENKISPVRQNIDDLPKHLQRRSSLYQKLGLPSILFQNKNILEVGPGSGHNSLYVASCKPSKYDLLEPNITAQNGINDLYSKTQLDVTIPNLIKKKLEDFSPDNKYEIVICESWLGVSDHEREMMKKLGSFLSSGGILVTTIASPLGSVINGVRRILSWGFTKNITSIESQTKLLLEAFSSHLDTIEDMSRLYEDWAQDTLINPGFLTMCPTPNMFVKDIGNDFEIYNSFPQFNSDWRWYKTLYGDKKSFNNTFLTAYNRNIHNFFDYNECFSEIDGDLGSRLEKESLKFISCISEKENNKDTVLDKQLTNSIQKIISLITEVDNNCWSKAFQELMKCLNSKIISPKDIANMPHFSKLFGRELIYVSAVKK
jgi:hypothetical protein